MIKILSQPYPFSEKSIKQIVFQSGLEGLFVALFLIVIQPFGISNMTSENKYFYLFLYGVVTSICVLFLRLFVFMKFSKYKSNKKWTVFSEILSVLALLSLITIGNYLLTILLFGLNNSLEGFLSMFFIVLIVGIFPTVFGVMANYLYHYKKYSKVIDIQQFVLNEEEVYQGSILKLVAENNKDFIEIEQKDLFYIESADNYSTIVFKKNDQLQKELIRSSLLRLESQIVDKKIVRCHRSFMVNLHNVVKVSGNAQGYKLHLNQYHLEVPVARKYSFLVENLK